MGLKARRLHRRLAATSSVVMLGSILGIVGTAGGPAGGQVDATATSVSVSDTTDLVDGQPVDVSWAPLDLLTLPYLCTADLASCVDLVVPHPVEFHNSTSPVTVPIPAAFQNDEDQSLIDCRVVACVVRVQEVTTPVTFDPAAPLLPDPIVSVSPSPLLSDGDIATVTMSGPWGLRGAAQCSPATCLDSVSADTSSLVSSMPIQVRSSIEGTECGAENCALDIQLHHPRVQLVRQAIAFDPNSPQVTNPQLSFAGTVSPGAPLALHGDGFLPNTYIRLAVCTPTLCTDESGYAGEDGTFEVEITVCAGAPCTVTAYGYGDVASVQLRGTETLEPFCDPLYEVTATEGISYRTASNYQGEPVDLKLDVYEPIGADPTTLRPVVLWMHGGYFAFGSRSSADFARIAASSGMVGISIDYRLRPLDNPAIPSGEAVTDAYDDASAAIEWILAHAEDYRIDPNAIIVGGFSAGAITALNLAYWDRHPNGFDPGAHVMMAVADSGLLWPGYEVDADEPPSAMLNGNEDSIVPITVAQGSCDAINAAGATCNIQVVADGGHGFGGNAEWTFAHPLVLSNGLADLGYCGTPSTVPVPPSPAPPPPPPGPDPNPPARPIVTPPNYTG